jgi:sirohydrochlorin cobaltochelatase
LFKEPLVFEQYYYCLLGKQGEIPSQARYRYSRVTNAIRFQRRAAMSFAHTESYGMAPSSPEGAIMKKLTLKLVLAVLPLSLLCLLSSCASSQVGAGKPVILVVSFGTSYNDTREKTIGAIENAIAAANPDYEVRRAFTSQIIINRVEKRDGVKIDNVTDAMKRLVKDKVKNLIVQPTHIMNGFEYDKMMAQVLPHEKKFASVRYGQPVLISDGDFREVASALIENTKQYDTDDTAVLFMGHGTEHDANAVYHKLDGLLKDQGSGRYFVGTVEAEPALDDIISELNPEEVKNIVLLPFMIVAGDHANNDMAGDEEDSWKSILESKGYSVTPIVKGLGEYPEIQQIFVRHVAEAAGK